MWTLEIAVIVVLVVEVPRLWLAIDPVTKIIPSLHLGERKSRDSYAVVHDLKQRLLAICVPSFLTDGLWSDFYAITAVGTKKSIRGQFW